MVVVIGVVDGTGFGGRPGWVWEKEVWRRSGGDITSIIITTCDGSGSG